MERATAAAVHRDHNPTLAGSTPVPATSSKKYQRVGQMLIRPLLLQTDGPCAYDLAQRFYAQYSELNFEDDLIDYMRHGFVITRPHLFAMVKVIQFEDEPIWYIRCIIGNLIEAIMCLPCILPKMAFCRNNNADNMVVVDTKRLIEIATRKQRKEQNGRR